MFTIMKLNKCLSGRLFLTSAMQNFSASERGAKLPPSPTVTTSRKIPTALKDAVTGDWASMMGLIRMRQEKGGLRVHFAGRWFDAVLRSDGRLGMEAHFLGFKLPVAELEEYSVSLESVDGQSLLGFRCHGILLSTCQKVESIPRDDAWKGRLGSWEITAPVLWDPAAISAKVWSWRAKPPMSAYGGRGSS
jgi:hypothetical protein